MATDDKNFTQADIDEAVKKALEKASEGEAGLKAKVEELLNESKNAKAKAKEAEEKAAEEARKAAEGSGDIEAIKKSYEDKIASIQSEHDKEISTLRTALTGATTEAQATALAAEIAVPGAERHVRRDILDRLKPEIVDGKVKTTILDKEGKPSAMTLDELKADISSDPANGNLIRASDASGGGAPKGNGGAGGLKRSEMSATDKNDYIEKNGQEAYLKLPKD